jgi:ATP phosphoribosyltransferase
MGAVQKEAAVGRVLLTEALREILERRRAKLTILTQDKTGRLYPVAWKLLEACMADAGIEVTEKMRERREKNKSLVYELPEFPGVCIASVRQSNMTTLVREYGADFAIIGEDQLDDDTKNLEVTGLGEGRSSLYIGVPEDSPISRPEDLAGKVIATSYAWALTAYLDERGIKPRKIVSLDGKVEAAVGLRIADAVCDIVETGRTMKENGLRRLPEKVRDFQAVLIRKKSTDAGEATRIQ